MSKKPSIAGLATAKAVKKAASKPATAATEFKHIQVRLSADDAKRFKRAAEDYGNLSLQAAMVEAINALMLSWGESPVSDPGTQLRAKKSAD